jgi:hypothetical protein
MKEAVCRDCGLRSFMSDEQECPIGWQMLHATGRMRCHNCADQLHAVNKQPDFEVTQFMPLEPVDLPPMSEPEDQHD